MYPEGARHTRGRKASIGIRIYDRGAMCAVQGRRVLIDNHRELAMVFPSLSIQMGIIKGFGGAGRDRTGASI